MKTYVIGDIHGNIKAFIQCLERSSFDYEKDKLIFLGDVCDGFEWVSDCFIEILKMKNIVYILGNHDWWARQYYHGMLFDPDEQRLWTSQGGSNTLKSYGYKMMDEEHLQILRDAKIYHYENDEKDLFVHGGIDHQKKIEKQDMHDLMWDRRLITSARKKSLQGRDIKFGGYENIFVGHTTTEAFKKKGVPITEPLHMCNVWMLDTGGGWNGKVTIMNIKTKKYWQSDIAEDLYEDVDNGRR